MKKSTTRIGLLALLIGTLFIVETHAGVITMDLNGRGGVIVNEKTGTTLICPIESPKHCARIVVNEDLANLGSGPITVWTEEGPMMFNSVEFNGPLVPTGHLMFNIKGRDVILKQ